MENETHDTSTKEQEHQQQQQQHGGSRPSTAGSTFSAKRARKNLALRRKLRQMSTQLAPLVQLTTGDVHPAFPTTLLSYWLLTEAELEGMARFYHQHTPCDWTEHYPCPVTWADDLTLEEKRRKIGKFIGLRGCETPIRLRTEEEIREEARRHREEADEELLRMKMLYSR